MSDRSEAFINLSRTRTIGGGVNLQTFSTDSHAVTQFQHQSLVQISSPGCPRSRQSLVCIKFLFNEVHLSTTEDCSVSKTTLKRRPTQRLRSHPSRTASARLFCKWLSLPGGSRAQRTPATVITICKSNSVLRRRHIYNLNTRT
jgi:hypothetical protein